MLVDHLGAFAATACYDELSVQDVDAAKLRVLDLLGAALAGVPAGRLAGRRSLLARATDVVAGGATREKALP